MMHRRSASHPGLHVIAVALAAVTFPLIFMGGLVTSHGAGMSVPDWPNSYGYNMFLFPPDQWVGGIFFEHVHRLLGTVVGFLSIMLLASAHGWAGRARPRRWFGWASLLAGGLAVGWVAVLMIASRAQGRAFPLRSALMQGVVVLAGVALVGLVLWCSRTREPRRWVRRLTVAILAAVVFQGALGGLRVVRINLDLAVIHGCFAQAFFCLTVMAAIVTGPWWRRAPDLSAGLDALAGRKLARLAVITLIAIYGQLIIGASMRHYRAGLAIPDFPLVYGQWRPPLSQVELDALQPPPLAAGGNAAAPLRNIAPPDSLYGRWMSAWPAGRSGAVGDDATLAGVWIHFAHRLGAVVVCLVAGWLVYKIIRLPRGRALLIRPAVVLAGLLACQVGLGMLTVLLRKPADVATLHVAVGALVLATTFVITARALRLYSLRRRVARWVEAPAGAGDSRAAAGQPMLGFATFGT